jgi:hypothetical protein
MQIKSGLVSKSKNNAELYQKIIDFPLDNPGARFPFSVQLAIDNDWSLDYTHQVIKEYKRFLFLMIVTGHKVSPSDQVDQAWHQHMLYSHSYWEDFCANTVHKQLHHWPAEGNPEFHDWYRKTVESYTQFFGNTPPEDIWVDPNIRLTARTYFIRTDREKNWVIPKWKVIGDVNKIVKHVRFILRFKLKQLRSKYFKKQAVKLIS